jgi:CMP/dCMP kinase
MSNNVVRIAISGKSGCGNTTVSKIVAERLNLRLINYTFHSIAEETGTDFSEICRLAENDDSYDRKVDETQIALASEGSCILGSRLAIWLLKEADLKFYLKASLDKRTHRIMEREGGDFATTFQETQCRDERDKARYLKLYSIDIDRFDTADIIIDAEENDQFEIAELIIHKVNELKKLP